MPKERETYLHKQQEPALIGDGRLLFYRLFVLGDGHSAPEMYLLRSIPIPVGV